MPSYKIHLLGGAVTYALAYKITQMSSLFPSYEPVYQILFLGLTLLGSIFPDIDVQSKMQRVFFVIALVALPFALFLCNTKIFIGMGIACLIPVILRHRTITHRVWFVVLAPAGLALMLSAYKASSCDLFFSGSLYFSMGALSHILLDFGPRRLFSRK